MLLRSACAEGGYAQAFTSQAMLLLFCFGIVQVHGDVFRPPSHTSLLAAFVGTGVQLLGMAMVTMLFALLGFLSPANRGGLMTAMLMMFVAMGLFAGYAAGRLYKALKGTEPKRMTAKTAFMFPGGWA